MPPRPEAAGAVDRQGTDVAGLLGRARADQAVPYAWTTAWTRSRLDVRLGVEDKTEAAADQCLVVGEQHADHADAGVPRQPDPMMTQSAPTDGHVLVTTAAYAPRHDC